MFGIPSPETKELVPKTLGFLKPVIASRQNGNSGFQHSENAISPFKVLKNLGK